MGDLWIRDFTPQDAPAFPEFDKNGIDPQMVPHPSFTALCDGEPIGCAGIVPIREGVGEAWIILKRPPKHGVWIALKTRRWLDEAIKSGTYQRIQTTIVSGDHDLARWMLVIGFEREGLLHRYGIRGEDCWMYSRTKRRRSRR